MESIVTILKRNRRRQGKQDGGFLKLFISKRLIHGAATAMAGIFVPIFLYKSTGEQFYIVGLYYAALSLAYALLLVPGMKLTNHLGFSRTLMVGGVMSVFTYVIMFLMNEENVWWLLGPLAISIVAFRIWHWVPYHVDFTLFTKSGERGRQVSLSFATIAFMGVVGPILAGFIIANAGYSVLFATIVALLLAATVSYAFVPETNTHFDWSYSKTIKELCSQERRGAMLGLVADGMETIVTLVVWPIFLYEILNGNVLEIGAVSTFIVGVTIIIQLVLGRYLDAKRGVKEKTLRVGSTLYAIGWILKIFVLSTAQVFLVGLYHNIVKIFTKTPFNTILYDMSADQGKYVDEFTVLREMATHFGRAIGLVIIAVLSFYIPIEWTFVLAAVASLLLNMIYRLSYD